MKINALFLILLYLVKSVCSASEPSKTNSQFHDQGEDSKSNRQLDLENRPVFLLKVKWPDIKDKEKITNGMLLPLRAYVRYEPRFFEVDPQTQEKKITGALGIDITDSNKRFLNEPHRLLGVGSVIPGKWLGDETPGRNYEYIGGQGPFATRFKPTNSPEKYRFVNFYKDGTVTEETLFPNSNFSNS